MFELICDALIGQDIHTWERKSLINERFFKMQHLASRINDKVSTLRKESMRAMKDLIRRAQDAIKNSETDMAANLDEFVKKFEKNGETLKHLLNG